MRIKPAIYDVRDGAGKAWRVRVSPLGIEAWHGPIGGAGPAERAPGERLVISWPAFFGLVLSVQRRQAPPKAPAPPAPKLVPPPNT